MPGPRPILKLSDPDPSYIAASALPFTDSRGFNTPHVHFPPTPIMTSTVTTHSASIYDRAPIVVSQNVCELPERGGRSYIPDVPTSSSKRPNCKRNNTGYFHPNAKSSDNSFLTEDGVSSSSPLFSPKGLNDFYNYHTQLQQSLPMHHRPAPLVIDRASDLETSHSSSISHISIRHYSTCSVPTSRSVSPTHTLSGSASAFVSCPPSPSMTLDKALSSRMVGLSLGITSSTSATAMTATTTTTTTTVLMTKESKRHSRSIDRSRERGRERDRQDKLDRFNAEDGEGQSKDYTEDSTQRTSSSKSRRRRLSICTTSSFQEPALDGCLGGF